MSQATTANRPVLMRDEAIKLMRFSPVYVVALTVVILLLSFFSDAIHQLIDPVYREQIQQEQESNREFVRALKRCEEHHR